MTCKQLELDDLLQELRQRFEIPLENQHFYRSMSLRMNGVAWCFTTPHKVSSEAAIQAAKRYALEKGWILDRQGESQPHLDWTICERVDVDVQVAYHSTPSSNVNLILRDGFKPGHPRDGGRKDNEGKIYFAKELGDPSHNGMKGLSSAFAWIGFLSGDRPETATAPWSILKADMTGIGDEDFVFRDPWSSNGIAVVVQDSFRPTFTSIAEDKIDPIPVLAPRGIDEWRASDHV